MIGSLIQILQDAFGISETQIQYLITRSPYSYKIYTIPKKSGGVRTIAQPAKETKYIQNWLIHNIFNKLPIHECAAAYKPGASIKSNATAHKSNQYISKFDFESFFPSIRESDLISHFSRYFGNSISSDDIARIARLSCLRSKGTGELALSIGAPSSPVLSNSIMYDFDHNVHQWCKLNNIIYTRYADDLTFSTNTKEICSDIEPAIREIITNIDYPRLRINDKKTIHLSKKNQRRITGVIINNDGEISIGRERKRVISALIHRFSIGNLAEKDLFNLQGMLGFSKDIEPEFISRMRKKYGPKVIDDIFRVRKPSQQFH